MDLLKNLKIIKTGTVRSFVEPANLDQLVECEYDKMRGEITVQVKISAGYLAADLRDHVHGANFIKEALHLAVYEDVIKDLCGLRNMTHQHLAASHAINDVINKLITKWRTPNDAPGTDGHSREY